MQSKTGKKGEIGSKEATICIGIISVAFLYEVTRLLINIIRLYLIPKIAQIWTLYTSSLELSVKLGKREFSTLRPFFDRKEAF